MQIKNFRFLALLLVFSLSWTAFGSTGEEHGEVENSGGGHGPRPEGVRERGRVHAEEEVLEPREPDG